jgi:hypothetical protein
MKWDAGSCVPHANFHRSFRYVMVEKRDAQGKRRSAWEPIMPRIKPEHEACIFFLYNAGRSAPIGTGFFVSRGLNVYAITNHHVAIRDGATQIRINTKDGSRQISTEVKGWVWSETADLAAYDVTDLLAEGDDVIAIYEEEFVTPYFVSAADLGLGDEVFMLGLLAGRAGADRNELSARFGSIAQMASDDAPIEVGGYKPKPAFLADMRSRGGYSGSPVIAFRTTFYDLRNFKKDDYLVNLGSLDGGDRPSSFMRLLGVNCGGKTEIMKLTGGDMAGSAVEAESNTSVVVPAWEISRLLDSDDLEHRRLERVVAGGTDQFVTHDLAAGGGDV